MIWIDPNDKHRHISHLYGMISVPENTDFTVTGHPDFIHTAARNPLESQRRCILQGGPMGMESFVPMGPFHGWATEHIKLIKQKQLRLTGDKNT